VKPSVWGIAVLTFSGTLGMYIFVPALSQAASDFAASPASIQFTISLYVLGLAAGQLVYGPLSDRLGRRPVLMGALGLFVLAGILAMLAPSTPVLIVARALQGMGGCAGLVLGRVIVRDVFPAREAAGRLAMVNIMMTLGPGLAPVLGGALTAGLGWRSVLLFLVLLGGAMLVYVWRFLPETRLLAEGGLASGALMQYRRLLRSRQFMAYAVGGACVTTAVYAIYAGAPFIFTGRLQRPPMEVGLYLGLVSMGIILGNVLASRLVRHVKLLTLVTGASLVSICAALGLLLVALAGTPSVLAVLLPAWFFAFAVGLAGPAVITLAIDAGPDGSGSASGLYGFTQMLVGAACAAGAGLGSDPALATGTVLLLAALIQQAAFTLVRRANAGAS